MYVKRKHRKAVENLGEV